VKGSAFAKGVGGPHSELRALLTQPLDVIQGSLPDRSGYDVRLIAIHELEVVDQEGVVGSLTTPTWHQRCGELSDEVAEE